MDLWHKIKEYNNMAGFTYRANAYFLKKLCSMNILHRLAMVSSIL